MLPQRLAALHGPGSRSRRGGVRCARPGTRHHRRGDWVRRLDEGVRALGHRLDDLTRDAGRAIDAGGGAFGGQAPVAVDQPAAATGERDDRDRGRGQLGGIGQSTRVDCHAGLALLGRDEARVRVHRPAVGLADLEVQVRHRAFGVAAVAHVSDHLTGPHWLPTVSCGDDLPLGTGERRRRCRVCRC